ncbi:MAG: viroplasmin family protein [Salinivirgaceae bacterium]|jgi:ribonuclease HI|nr:ribonuclease H [Bacteroidales bacterium]
MAKSKKKYYVVWVGRIPGIYETWNEVKDQVHGYENAKYKGFESLDAAREAYENDFNKYVGKYIVSKNSSVSNYIVNSIAVDAACSGNPGDLEYQGVYVKTGQRLFYQGPFKQGTNNVGEFLAIVHALAYCKKHGIDLPIYSDSRNAMIWIKQKKAKTKLFKSYENQQLFDLIDRAEFWLSNNEYPNKVLKWETEAWGEIPADFGRK